MTTYKATNSYYSQCLQKQKMLKAQSTVEQAELQAKNDKKRTKNQSQQQERVIVVKTKKTEPFKDKQLMTTSTNNFWVSNQYKYSRHKAHSNLPNENLYCVQNNSISKEFSRCSSNHKYFENQLEAKAINHCEQSNVYKSIESLKALNKKCVIAKELPSEATANVIADKKDTVNTFGAVYKTNEIDHISNEDMIKVSNWNTNITNNEMTTSLVNTFHEEAKPKAAQKKKTFSDFKPQEVKSYTANYNSNATVEDTEYFSNEDECLCEMTEEEKLLYGNRELKGYKRKKLLGKGGCGIVWLCECDDSHHQCAVKQVSKKTSNTQHTKIAKNEIEILTQLNEAEKCPFIVDIYSSVEDNHDIWCSIERGGKSLSSLVFKIKGEFLDNERIYSVRKGRFLKNMLSGKLIQFKLLIRSILEAISFISAKGIVHSDIKPENILVEYEDVSLDEVAITSVKVIDFGSAFYATKPSSFSSNTPEYMCPEITELLELTSYNKEKAKFLVDLVDCPWVVDIWSLGITLLELVLSCPIWMSFKAKVIIQGKVRSDYVIM